jgi:hypothetical protein
MITRLLAACLSYKSYVSDIHIHNHSCIDIIIYKVIVHTIIQIVACHAYIAIITRMSIITYIIMQLIMLIATYHTYA